MVPLSCTLREEVFPKKAARGLLSFKENMPDMEPLERACTAAMVPQALPIPSCCCKKNKPVSGELMEAFLARSASLLGRDIFDEGKRRHNAAHGCGTMIRRSGSKPNTSQNPHPSSSPKRLQKGFNTSGFDSRGSHEQPGASEVAILSAQQLAPIKHLCKA
jgi:hypothetical protein